jgi:hypothetical protein
MWQGCCYQQEGAGKTREPRRRICSQDTRSRLQAVHMLTMPLRFPRFPETFHRLLSGIWRVLKTSRLLRIASLLAVAPVVLVLCGITYITYNRPNLPNLDALIRFGPPTIGHIYDANGHVLIELGRERREIIQYGNIPDVLRQASAHSTARRL